ncbi:MAG TPA: isovaleryl-CoA dehydrogenase [Caulobacteraceae bacterium]|nr:isovaleryl-CoA dehydrogenase [Caulobacteraceae bacterium]
MEILNQPPPLQDYDLFASDRALAEAVRREGAAWAADDLSAYGRRLGAAETLALGEAANAFPPTLKIVDRFGHRLDRVDFHPAWHGLMALQVGQGIHCSPWSDPKPGAQVHRAAGLYMSGQVEAGTSCPISMTFAAAPVLRQASDIAKAWLPRIFSRAYDRSHAPAERKAGALIGMAMTENQGGSDLRTNTTAAEPDGTGAWRITGAKWFMSAPMCDAFLVLAQGPRGLGCYFMPRWTRAGELNAIRLQRLKDKLGNRSNASAEVVFEGAEAFLVGEEGRGIPTIIEMAALTRLDNVVSSAGIQRAALAQAIHWSRYRTAFQKRLIDQPLMAAVLADMALEVEAATALAFRLARAFEEDVDEAEAALRRLVTPAAKFWICKRGPVLAAEALEVLGGSGYIEESGMPRIYRELPVHSIWEGSGNVMALDARRALEREPASLEALAAELASARGADRRLDTAIDATLDVVSQRTDEAGLRGLCRGIVLTFQGALLARHAPAGVADAFMASRLGQSDGRVFGDLPAGIDTRAILERAAPALAA